MATQGFLDAAALKKFGGGTRARQIARLQREGIPYKLNGKDEVLVTWAHMNAWIEGQARPVQGRINWSALNA